MEQGPTLPVGPEPPAADLLARQWQSPGLSSPDLSAVEYRRAIEALRSGVPNRDAVKALGSNQQQIEEKFRLQLQAATAELERDAQAGGLLVAGDFGSGKSHLLEYLRHIALEEQFVCSKVVLSKETPLFDPAKLFRAAMETAVVPGKRGAALTEIVAGLDFAAPEFRDLYRWANSAEAGLNSQFAATLFLFEKVRDQEILDKIVAFWAGDPLKVADLRTWLNAQGEPGKYQRDRANAADLALQRFKFVYRLIVAAGYAGWVLLVDEAELIARYSLRQRARSYAELARWLGKRRGETYPGLLAVCAITTDFAETVLEGRKDATLIPERLRAREAPADHILASHAERGMRLISREAVRLSLPSRGMVDQTHDRVRAIHARAYDWDPPPAAAFERLATTSMRQYVRRWINEWDLQRLYPGYQVDTIVGELKLDYTEAVDLELPPEGETEPAQ
jgi:hypothetical protein